MKKINYKIFKFIYLKCPNCEKSSINSGFLKIRHNCENCNFKFKSKGDGWAGPSQVNYTVTSILLIILMAISVLIFKWQYFEYQALVVLFICVCFNLFFYRYAHSIWIHFLYRTNATP